MNIRGGGTMGALSTALMGINRQFDRVAEASGNIAAGRGSLTENVLNVKSAQSIGRFLMSLTKATLAVQHSAVDILV